MIYIQKTLTVAWWSNFIQYQIKADRNSPLRWIKKLIYIEKFSNTMKRLSEGKWEPDLCFFNLISFWANTNYLAIETHIIKKTRDKKTALNSAA